MLLTKAETNNYMSAKGKFTVMPPGVGDPMHVEKFNVRNLIDHVRAFHKGTCITTPKGE